MKPSEQFLKTKIQSMLTFNCFDHKRQYPVNEMCDWLEEFSTKELLEFVYDETRVNNLAEIYERSAHDASIVADICDAVIDKSGKLLGDVRTLVREGKSCTACKWNQAKFEYKCEACNRLSNFKRDIE